jgi:hypothetical protein
MRLQRQIDLQSLLAVANSWGTVLQIGRPNHAVTGARNTRDGPVPPSSHALHPIRALAARALASAKNRPLLHLLKTNRELMKAILLSNAIQIASNRNAPHLEKKGE